MPTKEEIYKNELLRCRDLFIGMENCDDDTLNDLRIIAHGYAWCIDEVLFEGCYRDENGKMVKP